VFLTFNAAQSELLPESGSKEDYIFNIMDLTFTWYCVLYASSY
jgi:hypothetical protein